MVASGGLPRYRGLVAPAAQPEGENVARCRWGPCEAGGWILDGGHRVSGEHGEWYHPGCKAAMEYANRPEKP